MCTRSTILVLALSLGAAAGGGTVPRTEQASALGRTLLSETWQRAWTLKGGGVEAATAVYEVRAGGDRLGRVTLEWKPGGYEVSFDAEAAHPLLLSRARWAIDCARFTETQPETEAFAAPEGEGFRLEFPESAAGSATLDADRRWVADVTPVGEGGEVARTFEHVRHDGFLLPQTVKMVGRQGGKEFASAQFRYVWTRRDGALLPSEIEVESVNEANRLVVTMGLETVAVTMPRLKPPEGSALSPYGEARAGTVVHYMEWKKVPPLFMSYGEVEFDLKVVEAGDRMLKIARTRRFEGKVDESKEEMPRFIPAAAYQEFLGKLGRKVRESTLRLGGRDIHCEVWETSHIEQVKQEPEDWEDVEEGGEGGEGEAGQEPEIREVRITEERWVSRDVPGWLVRFGASGEGRRVLMFEIRGFDW